MNEAGPGGRVASADRVRRGGIAGFFAREHFEVVDRVRRRRRRWRAAASVRRTCAADGLGTAPGAGARSWSDLIDVTEDVLEISGTSTGPGLTRAGQGGAGGRQASSTTADTPALGSEARMPSTQKASFAAMLSAIARDTVTGDGRGRRTR